MDFSFAPRVEELRRQVTAFMDRYVYPAEARAEQQVPASDPTQLQPAAVRVGDSYVTNGDKWFTTGAMHSAFAIVMTVSAPDAPPHRRASQIIVPADTPGFRIIRPVPVMGHTGGGGHC